MHCVTSYLLPLPSPLYFCGWALSFPSLPLSHRPPGHQRAVHHGRGNALGGDHEDLAQPGDAQRHVGLPAAREVERVEAGGGGKEGKG